MTSGPSQHGGDVIFAYEAQSLDGVPITGTIHAADADVARWRLGAMGLRLIDLKPAAAPVHAAASPARGTLSGETFAAFNRQLADLAAAGLPLERGLRLIAADLTSPRLRAAVNAVADDLENGTPLADAFARHAAHFPPLYGQVLEAGVKSGNLAGVLLALASHLQTTHELRQAIWRAVSYPLVVLASAAVVLIFLSMAVVPVVREVIGEMLDDIEMPAISRVVFAAADAVPTLLIVTLVVIVAAVAWWRWQSRLGRTPAIIDAALVPLPLIGPVLRHSLAARWCEGVRLAVESASPLGDAMRLAAEATGSPSLIHDAKILAQSHEAGRPVAEAVGLKILPATIPLAIDFAITRGELAPALTALRDTHQQQTRHRIAVLQAGLRPILVVLLAVVIGLIIAALLLPLNALVQAYT
jgi:type II secretory pathway component PulF